MRIKCTPLNSAGSSTGQELVKIEVWLSPEELLRVMGLDGPPSRQIQTLGKLLRRIESANKP